MNDRYLYRAKRTDSGEYVEGYYCKRKTGHYDNIGFHYEYKDCIIVEFSDGGITWCDVDPSTICQCTGVPDRNGKLIYENDKCMIRRPCVIAYGTIKYLDGCFCFVEDKTGNILRLCDVRTNGYQIKVESNIFDNPELLEVETVTIDEAIAHAREVAEQHREKCTQGDCDRLSKCIKCAEEHEQLAKWLEELKQYRAIGLTPNMVKEMIKSEQEATHYALIHDAVLKQYEEIGTVEECRAAVEKQKEMIAYCDENDCADCPYHNGNLKENRCMNDFIAKGGGVNE